MNRNEETAAFDQDRVQLLVLRYAIGDCDEGYEVPRRDESSTLLCFSKRDNPPESNISSLEGFNSTSILSALPLAQSIENQDVSHSDRFDLATSYISPQLAIYL
jgi:hypothetical protein